MFSRLGAIKQEPIKTEVEEHGQIFVQLDFYQLETGFDYSIKAKISHQIFSRYPHPTGNQFSSIADARKHAFNELKKFCINNKLKKQFNYCNAIQPELFD